MKFVEAVKIKLPFEIILLQKLRVIVGWIIMSSLGKHHAVILRMISDIGFFIAITFNIVKFWIKSSPLPLLGSYMLSFVRKMKEWLPLPRPSVASVVRILCFLWILFLAFMF
ncbi:uncharacterized protein LOC143594725 [Bidens hawaiensis]|uniref:uncharacterized protein LOC143594725 n=1 Tax=Bidens hawaiensis TaxID=980011 RepID=UPI00404B2BF1